MKLTVLGNRYKDGQWTGDKVFNINNHEGMQISTAVSNHIIPGWVAISFLKIKVLLRLERSGVFLCYC